MALSSSAYRHMMLLALFVIAFASYFSFDVPAALQDVLEQVLHINYTQYVLFYSLYAWPNAVLCLLGGFLLDKVGESKGVLVFALLSTLGQSVLAMGAYVGMFWIMLIGRILYAVGNEPLGVAITTVIMKHFRGKQANLIFGLQTSIEFASDCLSLNAAFPLFMLVSNFMHVRGNESHTETLGVMQFLVAGICAISLLFAPVVIWLDRRSAEARRREKQARRVAENPPGTNPIRPISRAATDINRFVHRARSYASIRAPRYDVSSESDLEEPEDRDTGYISAAGDSSPHREQLVRRVGSSTFLRAPRTLNHIPSDSDSEDDYSNVINFNINDDDDDSREQNTHREGKLPRIRSCTAIRTAPATIINEGSSEIESGREPERNGNEENNGAQDSGEFIEGTPQLGNVLAFPAGYWLVMCILMAYTGSVFSLIDVALVYYESKYGLDAASANLANSLIYLMTVLACPIAGYAVDRFGRNTQFVLVSILVALGAHALLAFTYVSPFVCSALFGLSYSLFASALWSMAVYLVPSELLGTAYGLLQAAENLGLGALILVVGALLDFSGYFINQLFLFALAAFALVLTVFLIGWSACHADPRFHVLYMSARERTVLLAAIEAQRNSPTYRAERNSGPRSSSTNPPV